jgi:hypothetical protein
MTYKGKYKPKNPSKYKGDPSNIVYRSLWERQVFRFMDEHDGVLNWGSETVVIPYRCKTDNKIHRYFMDVIFTTENGTYLIEVKPNKETQPPKEPKRKTKRYIKEVMTYIKNTSKWEAAEEYALDRGWKFEIWDEHKLKKLGIKLLRS